MADILSGLEKLGLGGMKNIEVYEKKPVEQNNKNNSNGAFDTKNDEVIPDESEFLFEKSYSCPCCYNDFKSKRLRTGKVRALQPDSDLRPRHKYIDTVKYDVVACPNCGYAAISSYFDYLTSFQANQIRERVSRNFKGLGQYGNSYTYDDAILRCKLAVLDTVVKKGKSSEKAFTCLKLAWLCRGKAEELNSGFWDADESDIEELKKEEMENIRLAYEGFNEAYSSERFPICGMNEPSYLYLLAELARRLDMIDDCKRIISRLLVEKEVSRNVKILLDQLREKLN